MEAGALGAEIVISGKLRTERARYEKFKAGYLVKCGEPSIRYMQKAEVHVQLKPGIFGVRVKIMPPTAVFPDKMKIVEALPDEPAKAVDETQESKSGAAEPEQAPSPESGGVEEESTEEEKEGGKEA
jgi:small subunit ribosomal protein S3